MADAEGEVFEFNVFSATLGYSRLHRFVYSRTRTEDDVMACLLAVMAANGGTARTLVTDNMSSHRLVLRLGAARLGALRQVRRRGGLRAGAGAAEEPADQGQGGVVEPVPVEAGRLRGRLPRRGGARGRHRAHRGAVQHRAQRVDRGAAGGAVHAREGGAAQGGQHGAFGVDGGRRLRPGGAPTMLVRCRGREFSVPRRCIGRRVKVLAMPSGQVRVEMAGRDRRGPRPVGPGRARRLRPGALRRGPGREGALRRRRHRGGGPRQPGAARQARGGVAVSARDEGGAYARIRENLSELGLDAMAAGLPHWMSAGGPPARPTSPRRCSP